MSSRAARTGVGAPECGVSLLRSVLLATVAELVLFGSGRLLQVGPVTARMGLFALGFGLSALLATQRRRVDAEVSALVLAFVVVMCLGTLVGLLRGQPLAQIAEDVKPLLFFLGAFFFDAAIRSPADVGRVAAVIRWSSVALAVGYLGLLAAVLAGVIPFAAVYAALVASGEVFFRGQSGFFYKGFLYLGVGIFFFAFRRGRWARAATGLLLVALALTLTRGLLLATVVVLGAALVLRQRHALAAAVYAGVGVAAVAIALPFAAAAFADRTDSDAARVNDVAEVVQATTWWSVLVGHGLGSPVGGRDRIEATYLEILHQQGIVGLALWALVLTLLARDYARARRAGQGTAAEPFFLGAVFVYLESATNPFLTNPIGMSMVLLSLVSLRVLSRGDGRVGPEPATEGVGAMTVRRS